MKKKRRRAKRGGFFRKLDKAGRERRRSNYQYVLDHLASHPCVDCGEKDVVVLEFDHLDRKRKRATITRLLHLSLETVKKEIEKCAVRCCNCHRRRTAKQLGWKNRLRVSAEQKERG